MVTNFKMFAWQKRELRQKPFFQSFEGDFEENKRRRDH